MPSETDRAWAAGFFDGEGYAGTSGPKKGHLRYAQANIAQVHREVLDKFVRIVEVGVIYGPYTEPKHPEKQPKYQYRCSGIDDVSCLYEIMAPYLGSVKSAAFDVALAAQMQNVDNRQMPADEKAMIIEMLLDGQSHGTIVETLGVSRRRVSYVRLKYSSLPRLRRKRRVEESIDTGLAASENIS